MSVDGKGLVLVIEDERSIADLERLYLSREGFGVHVEADGQAGLAAARRLHPVAIVLDVGLPTLDGTQVCQALQALRRLDAGAVRDCPRRRGRPGARARARG